MDAKQMTALRLSARALAEWRTPPSVVSYRDVVSDLIAVHPHAHDLRVDPDNKVFMFDEYGVILWYLSETLASPPIIEERGTNLEWSIVECSIKSLITFAGVGYDDREAWPKGPLTSEIADTIDRALAGMGNRGYAARALVSIAAPLGATVRSEMIRDLSIHGIVRSGYLQRISVRVRKLLETLSAVKGIASFASGGALVAALWLALSKKVPHSPSSVTTVGAALACAAAGLVVRWATDALSNLVLSGATERLSSKHPGKLSISYALGRALAASLLGIDNEVPPENKFPRLMGLASSVKERVGQLLLVALGDICGRGEHAMASLFRNAQEDLWRYAALVGTTRARASIVREIVPLVRKAEFSLELRYKMIKWLFSVEILED